MLDLCFVLLTIFMIAAPFLAESNELIIPTSQPTGNAVDPAKVYTLSLDKNGVISLNDQSMNRSEVVAGLRALHEKNPDMALLVRTHKELPVQQMIELMDFAREAGVAKVGVVTKTDVN